MNFSISHVDNAKKKAKKGHSKMQMESITFLQRQTRILTCDFHLQKLHI